MEKNTGGGGMEAIAGVEVTPGPESDEDGIELEQA